MKNDIKSLNPRLALLPVATILGSWLGAMVAYIIMCSDICPVLHHRQLTDCLAIDSGFAYYSLSSIFITEYRGAELGTIALLANIIREMTTLLLTPLIAKRFGPLAPISSGGATTMDTTLPIITQTVGQLRSTKHLPRFRDRLHRAVRSDNVVLYGWIKKVES